jgi:DNA-binding transcriptional MerR regulator
MVSVCGPTTATAGKDGLFGPGGDPPGPLREEGLALTDSPSAGRFDDEHYPAYSMGAAAELLGVAPAFLRSLGEAGLIRPHRSEGGHRRYTRHELRLAARARELVDGGMSLVAACRIVALEDQVSGLEEQLTGLEDELTRANQEVVDLRREARRLSGRTATAPRAAGTDPVPRRTGDREPSP